ncbi:hypothetical protein [Streptomyces sp. SGAir0957]
MNQRTLLPAPPIVPEGEAVEDPQAHRALPEVWHHVNWNPESGEQVATTSPSCTAADLTKEKRPIRSACTGRLRSSITLCSHEVAKKWRQFGVSVARKTHHAGFTITPPVEPSPLPLMEFR